MLKEKKIDQMPDRRQRSITNKLLMIVGAAMVVIFIIFSSSKPERSVASYCKVYKEEKARLAKLPGDTWPSGVFDDEVSDAGEFAKSFDRFDKVAPKEIEHDIRTLKLVYQKIHDDPTSAISASLNGAVPDATVKAWTAGRCSA